MRTRLQFPHENGYDDEGKRTLGVEVLEWLGIFPDLV